MSLRVVADNLDAPLVGTAALPGPDAIVTFRDADPPAEQSGAEWVAWLAGDERRPRGRPSRTISQERDGGWRRWLWPAADELFDLPAAPDGTALVIGDHSHPALEETLDELGRRGHTPLHAPRLSLDGLREAAVIAFPAVREAPPAEAPAVLAAGRVLVTGPWVDGLGLQPAIDHIRAASPSEAAVSVQAALEDPAAFAWMRSWARVTAAPLRATRLFGRLAFDLDAGS
jgi:hypothetical protein